MSTIVIKTNYAYPPIPCRNFDWCAYDDNTGPEFKTGWGATEQAAIDDLLEQLGIETTFTGETFADLEAMVVSAEGRA